MIRRIRRAPLQPPAGADAGSWRAIEAAATRRCMRRRWTVCLVALAVGFAIAAIGLVIVARDPTSSGYGSAGRRTVARVTDVVTATGGRGGPSQTLMFSFSLDDGSPATAQLPIGRTAQTYRAGQQVEIFYDARDPMMVSLAGTDQSTVPWFVPLPIGLVVLLVTFAASRRLRWMTRVLHENPWVAVDTRLIESPSLDGSDRDVLRLLEIAGVPGDASTLAIAATWRGKALDEFVPRAWIAGSDRVFVAAPVGGAPTLRVRRVRLVEPDGAGGGLRAPQLRSRLGDADSA